MLKSCSKPFQLVLFNGLVRDQSARFLRKCHPSSKIAPTIDDSHVARSVRPPRLRGKTPSSVFRLCYLGGLFPAFRFLVSWDVRFYALAVAAEQRRSRDTVDASGVGGLEAACLKIGNIPIKFVVGNLPQESSELSLFHAKLSKFTVLQVCKAGVFSIIDFDGCSPRQD